ncbi:UNVERIFIED_CONTAM: hypothetical protein HDU68_009058 [Siphonaria sp. JEL0065]|nr:hypothetical protein HDU68_009058 [Siphonaria sp. JEL0065]
MLTLESRLKLYQYSRILTIIFTIRILVKALKPFRIWLYWRIKNWRFGSRITCRVPNEAVFDYIIVGAGSAGCVIANRLSEDASVSVLLVEAGKDKSSDPRVNIPSMFPDTQMNEMDWKYKTVADPGTKNRTHYWPRGKLLGGCSSTNACVYVRGNKQDFNEWESKHGCDGWNFNKLLPYFKKSEGCEIDSSEIDVNYHSTTGPLKVSRARSNNPHTIAKAFVAASQLLGISQNLNSKREPTQPAKGIDYNGQSQYGASIAQATISGGERCSTSRAFLEPIVNPGKPGFRRNLTVLTGYIASKVLQSGRKDEYGLLLVDGVQLVSDDSKKRTFTVGARKEVILSCGAIGSPKILLHSGIGRKQDLIKHGISVIADLPAVGYHMQDHIFVPIPYHDLSETVLKKTAKVVVNGVCQYLWNKTGPLTSSGLEAVAFLNVGSKDGEGSRSKGPNMQLHLLPAMAAPDATQRVLRNTITLTPLDPSKPSTFNKEEAINEYLQIEREAEASYFAYIFPTLLHPTSKGSISLSSADPFSPPIITPNYLSTKQDVDTLVEGVIAARAIMDKTRTLIPKTLGTEWLDRGLVNEIKRIRGVLNVEDVDPAFEEAIIKSREYIQERVKRDALTVYHPVGTCRMGPREGGETVVSHRDLKVHGFGNLRVADASVMPEITSGNTNAPVIMIGEMLPITLLIATASTVTAAAVQNAVPFSKDFTAPINPPAVYLDSGKRLAVYYGGWSTYNNNVAGNAPTLPYPFENYQPADIPIGLVTDVNYSFYVIANKTANVMSEVPTSKDNYADYLQKFNPSNVENPSIHAVTPDTDDQKYFGNFGQFLKLKKRNKYNFGLAIGGWIDSVYFSSAMKTPKVFVQGIIDVLKAYPGLINHIDIDWEYIQNTPTDNYGAGNEASVDDPKHFGKLQFSSTLKTFLTFPYIAKFLRILRERLDEEHLSNMEITAALPANPAAINMLPIKAMIEYVDFFNIMTYDFQSSAWGSEIAGPQSNLYTVEPYASASADRAVKTFRALGVPSEKIMIGVAFYTRANGNTKGMNQTTSGEGSEYLLSKCINDGSCDYRWMPLPGHVEKWDSASKATYSLDAERGDMLTYDSVYSVAEKCQYVWDNNLAGLFAWEAGNDVRDPKSKRSLMAAMNKCLKKDPRRNHGTKCNSRKESNGCAATALATCTNNKWVVSACPDGQVCQGEGKDSKCALP